MKSFKNYFLQPFSSGVVEHLPYAQQLQVLLSSCDSYYSLVVVYSILNGNNMVRCCFGGKVVFPISTNMWLQIGFSYFAWPEASICENVHWNCYFLVRLKSGIRDFPGGSVVKNPPANAGDTGLSPGLGRSCMTSGTAKKNPKKQTTMNCPQIKFSKASQKSLAEKG